jgi:hypothetical protein
MCCVYAIAVAATKTNPPKQKKKKKGVLHLHKLLQPSMCCVCATTTATTKTNPPKKKREFCASIIVATKWLWSSFTVAAIAPAVAIPVIAVVAVALVVVNRRMMGWMKCLSGWMTVRVD